MPNPFKTEAEAQEAIRRIGGVPKGSERGAGIGTKKRKPMSNKAVGIAGEEIAIDEMVEQLGRVRTSKDHRENQAVIGGDTGIPDFSIQHLDGIYAESKCGKFMYADFWMQIFENCPTEKVPVLLYRQDLRTPGFIMFQTKDLMKVIRRVLAAAAEGRA